ncbi:hypothetical protein ND748_00960 [Frankia sp. AiPs1]|uniref:hypothetical protein n=1 Tax=Frankia sp. AiPs1 TaxID=573493 RepID=UPI0020430463|nr:hypothetical protein [Frankia sp. AiPs1]MCM3920259.1 hypothetical protein [Frankia sp. AiPs1]
MTRCLAAVIVVVEGAGCGDTVGVGFGCGVIAAFVGVAALVGSAAAVARLADVSLADAIVFAVAGGEPLQSRRASGARRREMPSGSWRGWFYQADSASERRLRVHMNANRLATHLLARASHRLPEPFRERFTEEWQDHRAHYQGWRLLWWALCVRATATRTARELRRAQLPHTDR